MSTTDTLRARVAPTAARSQAVAAAKPSSNTLLGIVCSKSFQPQMALALPKTMTVDRLTRIIMTGCRKTPQLLKFNRESCLGSVLQCAQLGLEPCSALGHCYLLPFGNGKAKDGLPNCQLIIGYRGMIDLARRSGQIKSISAYCVHEADDFHYELGLHPDIHHIPTATADRGPVTYVYAVAQLKDGGAQFEVMNRVEIEEVRPASKAGTSGPWSTHWSEMAKKTVIRRLFKYLSVSIDTVRAIEVDEKSERGEAVTQADFIDATYVDKGQVVESIDVGEGPETTPIEVIEPDTKNAGAQQHHKPPGPKTSGKNGTSESPQKTRQVATLHSHADHRPVPPVLAQGNDALL